MAIGAIEMQGQILRTQDYSTIKAQEDARGELAQDNIHNIRQSEEVRQANRVSGTQASANTKNDQSASDKGSNEYTGDGGARRREAREARARDGKVLLKAIEHIDIKG
ncbi:MAG: hypothetical protein J5509_01755 [Lachnospiraceae bacterium]|nr:hypothetical protein [Lachnospiraceae bacterium]